MVPTLGLAAHGAASGVVPGAPAAALCLFLGVVTGVVVDVASRLRGTGWVPLIGILTVAQGLAHLALSVGHDHHAMSPMPGHEMAGHAMPAMSTGGMLAHHLHALLTPWSANGAVMVLTHVIAVPLTAVLIALAAAVTGVATSVAAALRGPGPRPRSVDPVPVAVPAVVPYARIDRAAGPGKRGPPALLVPV